MLGLARYKRVLHGSRLKTRLNTMVFKIFVLNTVNTYFVPQGHKARTWVMPHGRSSVITCMIDLKLGENVFPDLADQDAF